MIKPVLVLFFILGICQRSGSQDAGTAEKLLPLLKDPDATVRLSAVRSLGSMGVRDYASSLVPLLEDEDGRVRWAVAASLKDLQGKFLERDVATLLGRPQGGIRADAAFCLSVIDSKAFLSELQALLGDRDPRARAAAVFALGKLGGNTFSRDISNLLSDKDARVKWAAVSTLGKLKATPFDREVVKLIADPDSLLRWAAWTTLAAFDAKGWISSDIESLLTHKDSGIRGDAVLAVGLFKITAFSSNCAELLRDSDARVRWSAVLVLHRLAATAFLTDVQKLLEDPDRDVRRAAAAAIPTLEGKKTDKPIPLIDEVSAVSRLDPSTVFVHGGYVRQVARTIDALESPMHWSSALSLGRIPGRAGVDDLASLMDHPLPEVRRSAVWILDQWGSPMAILALRRAADLETDPLVQANIRNALERAAKKD